MPKEHFEPPRFGLLIIDGLSIVAFDDPVPLAAHSQPDDRPAGPAARASAPPGHSSTSSPVTKSLDVSYC